MRNLKIVYCFQGVFTQRDYDRYGVGFMLNRGVRVTILDVGEIVLPFISQNRCHYSDWKDLDLHECRTMSEFADKHETLSSADLIVAVVQSYGVSRWNRHVLREISRCGTPYIIISTHTITGTHMPRFSRQSIKEMIAGLKQKVFMTDYVNSVVSRIPIRFFGIRPADFVVYGGRGSQRHNSLVDDSTTAIFAHAMDYDHYLRILADKPAESNTAVFVDQNLTKHHDFIEFGTAKETHPETYYSSLRDLFDRVESETGLRVVIAAHPRRIIDEAGDLFGNREVVQGRTHELVASCRLTILHVSAVALFAVLLRKPVLIVSCDEYCRKDPAHTSKLRGLAEAIGSDVIDILEARQLNVLSRMNIDEDHYNAYIEYYVKRPDTPNLPFWQIVVDSLSEKGIFSN